MDVSGQRSGLKVLPPDENSLLPLDGDAAWSTDGEFHAVGANLYDFYFHVVANQDGFTRPAAQNQHAAAAGDSR